MTQADFDAYVHPYYDNPYVPHRQIRLVRSVKTAIHEGIHPKMITKGSSGSYFARAKVEGRVQTVA